MVRTSISFGTLRKTLVPPARMALARMGSAAFLAPRDAHLALEAAAALDDDLVH